MLNMDESCTLKYSFKLPPANKALQKIRYDSDCPHRRGRDGTFGDKIAIDWAMAMAGAVSCRPLAEEDPV